MYLCVRKIGETENNDDGEYVGHKEVGYWRKVNQIHEYFDNLIEGGIENCEDYVITQEQLEDLHHTCKVVLTDHDKAEDLLPTSSGSFFGSLEYDNDYFQDLEHTLEILENVLTGTDFTKFEILYGASW